MTTSAPVLACSGLAAGYAGTPAIQEVDLEVHAGEVVALLGPNGAGKTTTLMSLAGAIRPMAGAVSLDGIPTRAPLHRRVRRGLALVTEERSVIGELTAADNLRIGRGRPDRAVELFPELGDHLRRPARLLSGGQQQMLTTARALASDPRCLLADELSLGLAPVVVQRLLRGIRAAAERGVGVLLVEQHARIALAHSDRAYVLARGRVVAHGNSSELSRDLDELERTYLHGVGD